MKEDYRYQFYLSKMYEFINDIQKSLKIHNYNYDEIFSNFEAKHSINMCIVQIGELADSIKRNCPNYYNKNINFKGAKEMRNRIVHGYGTIDYEVVKNTINNSIPVLKSFIEKEVEKEILDNPYSLYEIDRANE